MDTDRKNSRRQRWAKRLRDEKGGIQALETAGLAIGILFLFAVFIQVAYMFVGRNVVMSAAQEGVRANTGTNPASARAAARDFARTAGDGTVSNVEVSTSRRSNQVSVTVSAQTISLVPGWRPTVTQTATGPVERWTN